MPKKLLYSYDWEFNPKPIDASVYSKLAQDVYLEWLEANPEWKGKMVSYAMSVKEYTNGNSSMKVNVENPHAPWLTKSAIFWIVAVVVIAISLFFS